MRQPETGPYQLFALGLSLFVLLMLATQTLVPIAPETRTVLEYADFAVCLLFFVDFGVSLVKASDRKAYLLRWGWVLEGDHAVVERTHQHCRLRTNRQMRGLARETVLATTTKPSPPRRSTATTSSPNSAAVSALTKPAIRARSVTARACGDATAPRRSHLAAAARTACDSSATSTFVHRKRGLMNATTAGRRTIVLPAETSIASATRPPRRKWKRKPVSPSMP